MFSFWLNENSQAEKNLNSTCETTQNYNGICIHSFLFSELSNFAELTNM